MNEQLMGLIFGLLFGLLLQKARVLRFEKQVGAMLFRDMTIFKFMLSSIVVSAIGLQLFDAAGLVAFKHKALIWGPIVVGGVLFGVGWAVAGYCPGTAWGALGEGRRHALWAILGMLAGAALYAHLYPLLQDNLLSWGDMGKIPMPGSPWLWVAVLALISGGAFAAFEKYKV